VTIGTDTFFWNGTVCLPINQMADAVTHGGATALMHLGGGSAGTPSLTIRNSAGGKAALFEWIDGADYSYVSIGDGGQKSAVVAETRLSSGASGVYLAHMSTNTAIAFSANAELGTGPATLASFWNAGSCYNAAAGGPLASGMDGYVTEDNYSTLTRAAFCWSSTGETFRGTGKFSISGTTTLTGAVSLGSTLGVTGATTFTGAVSAINASNDIRLGATERNSIADALLKRDIDNVEATAAIHSLCTAALKLVSKFDIGTLGTATIFRTDGTTPHATQAVTTNAALVATQTLGLAS
jgi:hypothetical protein